MGVLSVADVLERAADLIEPEGAWTQGVWARLASGAPTSPFRDDCACRCMRGAIVKAKGGNLMERLEPHHDALGFKSSLGMVKWNDAPGRTQAEVVARLRKAASLSRQENPNG